MPRECYMSSFFCMCYLFYNNVLTIPKKLVDLEILLESILNSACLTSSRFERFN